MNKKNIVLVIICIVLIVGPFIISENGEFEGADAQAEGIINQLAPDYDPWFESLWEPPSSEVESFLFAMQAAVGAGFIGYYIGRKKSNGKTNKSI